MGANSKETTNSKRTDIRKDVERFGLQEPFEYYKHKLSGKSKPTLAHLAWCLYSDYLLLSKSLDGWCTCVTCGAVKYWTDPNMHPAHFLEQGKSLKHKFDDNNVRPGCVYCNVLLHGNYKKYTIFMINKFGQKYVDDLLIDKGTITIKNWQYADMILERWSKLLEMMKFCPVK